MGSCSLDSLSPSKPVNQLNPSSSPSVSNCSCLLPLKVLSYEQLATNRPQYLAFFLWAPLKKSGFITPAFHLHTGFPKKPSMNRWESFSMVFLVTFHSMNIIFVINSGILKCLYEQDPNSLRGICGMIFHISLINNLSGAGEPNFKDTVIHNHSNLKQNWCWIVHPSVAIKGSARSKQPTSWVTF